MPLSGRRPRSATWRGALWITAITLAASSLALSLQYVQTNRLIAERTHTQVDDEMRALLARYRETGLDGVAQAITVQQDVPRIHEFFYLLAQPDGAPLAGNLAAWPAEVTDPGFHRFATAVSNTRDTKSRRWVEARAVVLEGGVRLLVGDFADEQAVLRDQYVSALFWSFACTGVLGLLLGWWYSRRGLAFVDAVSDAGDRFLAGRLGERLPISARGDEYDRLGETINRSFAEVERLIGSLRAATDGMAHDLKTPLTRIKARLELADMERAKDPAAMRTILADSRRDLDALLSLIDGLLTLARVDATPSDSFTAVRLDTIVTEAVELFQPLADDKNIDLEFELAQVQVLGARSLLAQLVTNLLDNAIKHNVRHGTVKLSVATDSGHDVVLRVVDAGPGIAPGEREAALARFARLTERAATPGSGLGLSIAAAIARVHGAELTLADNAPGLIAEVRFQPFETARHGL